jgi:predicted hydrocarbon binding protein
MNLEETKHVKGIHLANIFKFVKWKRGILGTQRFMDAWHSEKGRMKIDPDTFIEKEWYDYELYLELLRVADKTVGTGDLSKIYEIGYWNIRNLGHLSYLARSPDIEEFLKGAHENWHTVYDFGSVDIVTNEDRRIVIRYSGLPEVPEKCLYFRGSLTGMMEICGLNGQVKETVCNTKGGEYCEFELTWE